MAKPVQEGQPAAPLLIRAQLARRSPLHGAGRDREPSVGGNCPAPPAAVARPVKRCHRAARKGFRLPLPVRRRAFVEAERWIEGARTFRRCGRSPGRSSIQAPLCCTSGCALLASRSRSLRVKVTACRHQVPAPLQGFRPRLKPVISPASPASIRQPKPAGQATAEAGVGGGAPRPRPHRRSGRRPFAPARRLRRASSICKGVPHPRPARSARTPARPGQGLRAAVSPAC